MESTTTYTRRENARRAAVALGVPRELVQITVHKNDGGVRFGWKKSAMQATKALATRVGAKLPNKRPIDDHNAIRRPKAGGICAAIWDWLDVHPNAALSEVRAAGLTQGWNKNNLTCEYYNWRKYNREK